MVIRKSVMLQKSASDMKLNNVRGKSYITRSNNENNNELEIHSKPNFSEYINNKNVIDEELMLERSKNSDSYNNTKNQNYDNSNEGVEKFRKSLAKFNKNVSNKNINNLSIPDTSNETYSPNNIKNNINDEEEKCKSSNEDNINIKNGKLNI